MSLPSFKFTSGLKPTNDDSVNSGLSPNSKMSISGGIPDIISKAKTTASSLEFPTFSSISTPSFLSSETDQEETSYFSFTFLIRLILIVVIGWFMWVNLADHGEFNLGMESVLSKIKEFLHSMEENGRVFVARISGNIADYKSGGGERKDTDTDTATDTSDGINSEEDTGISSSGQVRQKRDIKPPTQTSGDSINPNIPVPPPMTNSADKKPGFSNEDTKYTFLDKAVRNYSGPSPRPDDSKHESGKSGYCYIGEDRGFRSCTKVEAGDKCMSGKVFSRQDICIDPTLRE
jgi:hypothetical protein